MNNYVLLEWDDNLNCLLDIISAQGHPLKKIVSNDTQNIQLSSIFSPVSIESWDTFQTQEDETYFCGLIGKKAKIFHQQIKENMGIIFAPLIHPHALISPTAQVGSGSVIAAGAIIASNVIVGEGCFVGQGVIFGHDTVIENYVTIQSGVQLAGHITIEQQAIIDMGATIIEDVSIGHDAVVEAGAVVLKNVPSQTIVSGVPAKNKTIVN